jgi:transposase-like protein
MHREQLTVEEIIRLLRDVDMKLSLRKNLRQIFWEMGISEQTYYRWRKEYGEMKAALVLVNRDRVLK